MSEKRDPDLTMLLRFKGNNKSLKFEFFKATQWGHEKRLTNEFRVRRDGVWWPEGEKKFFKISQVKELVFQGLNRKLN